MTFTVRPDEVPDELVALTRRIGDPAADLVVLAEGNTSVRLDGDRFAVKASGSRMDLAEAGDFVVGELPALVDVLEKGGTDQETLSRLLSAAEPASADGTAGCSRERAVPEGPASPPERSGGNRIRASIETLVHVVALAAGATWVAHTHPTAVVGLLAVREAEELWSAPLFPDEAVVLGEPVWVPYAAPGIALGAAVHTAVRERLDRDGVAPRLVLLGNHGIVALGATASEVETITTMAVKAARVRSVGLGAGTLAPLGIEHARELAGRPDEAARRTLLGRSRP
ncbi:class II aldolase/adducin N-terminal domain-containing protein [Pseudonocardia hierapolitana]|uniref:Class II aldolase/adducin N-terminal domain-containing protein n=1 Tax=Pseudonocardia hierapolitana TaxID=1128676 RepID=A0A561SQM8_9PSEU|nr:class II aldolase/adducin family protein [Pseudonocardia hierapolitana]TWF77158.1 class II aldolase/adducin N-terminal domain-containing protein [Pseudonocardia hierapolitana]